MGYNVKTYKTKNGVEYVLFADMKREALRDPEFQKAYDALGPKYALIGAMLDARNKRGMTQSEIARRAGTTQSAIARFESVGRIRRSSLPRGSLAHSARSSRFGFRNDEAAPAPHRDYSV